MALTEEFVWAFYIKNYFAWAFIDCFNSCPEDSIVSFDSTCFSFFSQLLGKYVLCILLFLTVLKWLKTEADRGNVTSVLEIRCLRNMTCSYVGDTQVYIISAEPNDAAVINSITACLLAMNKWMSNHFLKINEDKREILLVEPKAKREMLLNNLEKWPPWSKSENTSLGGSPYLYSNIGCCWFHNHIWRIGSIKIW